MGKLFQKKAIFPFILILAFLFPSFCVAADGIKERMKARVPTITSLKSSGVVGENNQGFLEFRKKDNNQVNIINDENSDRRKVYSAIAKQQNTSAELVGRRRAKQIAEIARPGTWLQKQDNSWSKKQEIVRN
ncbi:YdbL family protein [Candidatus Pacearchaeota archaeon]|nr:YdbL family protein [Candidatus Pacearchaeota archaeon]